MKRSFWVFTLVLVLAVVLIEFDLARRSARLVANQTKKTTTMASNKTATPTVSSALSQPEESEQKNQDLAKKLSPKELKRLADIMVDRKADEDQRALAIQLVARNQTVASLKELEDFVLHKKGYSFFNRKDELETVLKAQAIEGIAAFPQKDLAISSLTSLDPKIDESFLKDRIKRSMAVLQNQVEKSEDVDTDALQKLVE